MSGHPCAERLLLPEALSGRLEPSEEKRVMAHLQTCSTCQDVAADIEVSLISLAVLRDEHPVPLRVPGLAADDADEADESGGRAASSAGLTGPWPRAPLAPAPAPAPGAAPGPVVLPQRRRLPAYAAAAAAAVVFAAGGLFVGHDLLPPRDRPDFGPAVALSPPPGATDTGARGTVAVASESDALAVRLDVTSLPTTGWYECVWVAGGQSRSAGSFRAVNGVAKDVQLRVAQPQDSTGWDLQVVHHQGDTSDVVLEGDVTYG
ncbi:MAG: zf-HC2 domain-containing protein [Actinomycetales bacterium]